MREPRSGSSASRPRLSGFEQRALRRLHRLALAPDACLVLGFSGGPDSLALTALMRRLSGLAKVRVVAVHVDHQLRAGSAEEQQRAGGLAAALGVPFRAERVAASPLARHPGVGVEEAARRERYRVLASVARDEGAAAVCLAHHQQDQAETVLLHLLRGAGLAGAAGMAEWSILPLPWWPDAGSDQPEPLTLWRPLLGETKDAVRRYAEATGLDPVNDPSNVDEGFLRNAIRLQAIPLLDGLRPGAIPALARFAELAAEDDAVLATIATDGLARMRDVEGRLDASALMREEKAIRRRIVQRWLIEAGGGSVPSMERVDAVLGLVAQGIGDRYLEVGEGRAVTLIHGRVTVGNLAVLVEQAAHDFGGPLFPARAVEEGVVPVPGHRRIGDYEVRVARQGDQPEEGSEAFHHAAVAIVPPEEVEVRSPRPGDRWARSGRRLGDWLTAQKVSTLIRGRLLCVATGGAVHLVVGMALPPFEEVDEGAAHMVRITVTRTEGA